MLGKKLKAIARKAAVRINGFGSAIECPICGWTGFQFMPVSHPHVSHSNAICPRCGSSERMRLAYVAMDRRLTGRESALHFAPEPALTDWLRGRVSQYTTCDIEPGAAECVIDIQDIDFPDETFDLVWCSHVLEHVPDDRKAMRELHRVTRPGGLCVVQVPLWHETTDEDPGITDETERERRFLQSDHLRLYGDDIYDRLTDAGFAVRIVKPHHFPPRQVFRHQIAQPGNYEVFLCSKN